MLPLAVFHSNLLRQACTGGGQLERLSNRDFSGYLLPLPSCEASTADSRERASAVGETVSMRAAGGSSTGAVEQVDTSAV